MKRFEELRIPPNQMEELTTRICNLQGELKKESPRKAVISAGLNFVIGTLGSAAGTALAGNWGPLVDQVKLFVKSLSS
jgi:hypothetical protein